VCVNMLRCEEDILCLGVVLSNMCENCKICVCSEVDTCMELLCMCRKKYIYIYARSDLCICTIGDVSITHRNMNMCDNQMKYTCIPCKNKNTYVVKYVYMCVHILSLQNTHVDILEGVRLSGSLLSHFHPTFVPRGTCLKK
jgi:hypothetical protein